MTKLESKRQKMDRSERKGLLRDAHKGGRDSRETWREKGNRGSLTEETEVGDMKRAEKPRGTGGETNRDKRKGDIKRQEREEERLRASRN